ncbi:MAG: PilW family protein [Vicinamibacterales bacterium]
MTKPVTCLGAGERGFTLLEMTVASGLLLVVLLLAMRPLPSTEALFDAHSEASDMQQRMRAATDALRRDIGDAGGAGTLESDGTPLIAWTPALWPMRLGLRSPDPPGTARTDVLTILSALPLPAVPTRTAHDMAAQDGSLRVLHDPGCAPMSTVCGLAVDTDLLITDGHGTFDLFTVTEVTPPTLRVRHNGTDWTHSYPAGSRVIPVRSRTYTLRQAGNGRPPQLVRYDGTEGPDAAIVDHVVGFAVEYLADPDPPRMRRPLSDPAGPWTTYGPPPPVADEAVIPVIAGSNCLFHGNGTPLASAGLPPLGPADGPLVPLRSDQLSDGPWCPEAASPVRYDADLLRIRSVELTVRIESALDALRGPAGTFTRPGTASDPRRLLPDVELHLRITPPALVSGR